MKNSYAEIRRQVLTYLKLLKANKPLRSEEEQPHYLLLRRKLIKLLALLKKWCVEHAQLLQEVAELEKNATFQEYEERLKN